MDLFVNTLVEEAVIKFDTSGISLVNANVPVEFGNVKSFVPLLNSAPVKFNINFLEKL